MSDCCYSTIVCAHLDANVFEKLGYVAQEALALTIDGDEIPGAVVMIAEEAENGKYNELTSLTSVPFIVSNACCSGSFGDHLIVADGVQCRYAESLHESSYPTVRVAPDGTVQQLEVDDARKYWAVYKGAIAVIKRAGATKGRTVASSSDGLR